jgi:lipopolysaccharide biosynthesis glycosyltransferase
MPAKPSETTTHIALVANERFFTGLWATVISLLAQLESGCATTLNVVDFGIDDESWNRLVNAVEMHPHPPEIRRIPFPDSLMSQALSVPTESKPAFARLYFPELFDFNELIYLDSDLLVFRNLNELKDVDLSGYAGAAVLNEDGAVLNFDLDTATCSRIGRDPNSPYFNTGVLVMNLKYWRENNLTRRCEDFLRSNPAPFNDQTAINAVLNDKLIILENAWNRLVGRFPVSELHQPDRVVLHYCCEKPWLENQKTPSAALFEKFCRDTGLKWPRDHVNGIDPEKYSMSSLRRTLLYRLLSLGHRLFGNLEKAKSYLETCNFWDRQFKSRHVRKDADEKALRLVCMQNFRPSWLDVSGATLEGLGESCESNVA